MDRCNPIQSRQPHHLSDGRRGIMDFYRTAPFPNQAVTSHDQPDAGTIHKSHIPKIQYQRVWTNSLQHSVNFFPQAARPMMVNLSNQVGSYPLFFGIQLEWHCRSSFYPSYPFRVSFSNRKKPLFRFTYQNKGLSLKNLSQRRGLSVFLFSRKPRQ